MSDQTQTFGEPHQTPDGAGTGEGRTAGPGRTCALGTPWGIPEPDVQAELRATLGAVLRSERTSRGLSVRRLAHRALCAHTTVLRLEAGTRRPRASLLSGLATGLDPDDPTPLRDRLIEAAGRHLAEDTEAGTRRRKRAELEAWQAGRYPLPARLGHQLAMADHVDRVTAGWLCSLNRVIANPDSDEALTTAEALGAQLRTAQRALDEAGGPARSSYGLGGRPARLRGAGAVLG